ATTGSLTSEVPHCIINLGEQQGEAAFLWYKEQFGDDFYVEINRQYKTQDESYANEKLLSLAKKHGVNYFAANSNYYIDKKGSVAHDILLCVKDGEKKSTAVGKGRGLRYGMPNQEFYFKSPAEMAALFKDMPEAL